MSARSDRRIAAGALLAIALVLSASLAFAQFRRGGYYRRPAFATLKDFDGGFQFCRVVFRNWNGGDGAGWGVDWPRADENLSIRLSELSRVPVSMHGDKEPKPLLVQFKDPLINHCPFIMMTEPGGAFLDDEEVRGLRNYLEHGGFLWADDFWGEEAWDNWETQLRKVLPSTTYPIYEVAL